MDKQVKLEISVDDKGAVTALRQFSDAATKAGATSKSMAASIKENWLGVSAAIYAACSMVNKAWVLAEQGAKEKQISEAFHNVAKSYNQDAEQIIKSMKLASAGTIAESDLMQKAIKGMTQDLSGKDMVKIAEIARVAARTTGKDVSEMFDIISDSIANKLPKALNKLGLVSKEELKILNDAIAAGVEGTTLLDLAFLQATKSGAAMGGMAKQDAEHIQSMGAAYKDMYDELAQGVLSYGKALLTIGQSDMSLAGLSPGPSILKGSSGPSHEAELARRYSVDLALNEKNRVLEDLKLKTAAAKAKEEAAKLAIKAVEGQQKAFVAMYTKIAEGEQAAYDAQVKYEYDGWKQIYKDRLDAHEKLITETDAWEQLAYTAQVKYELDGFKTTEKYAKDKADVNKQLYSDIGKTTKESYAFKIKLLDEEYAKYRLVVGDSTALNEAYAQRKKQMDQDLILSGNNFFAGIKVGYERMLDDQMTWAKSGAAIFNSFASNGKNTLSNVLFDGIKGDLKTFDDYWKSYFDGLLRTFTDTVAEMATQKLATKVINPLVGYVGGAAGAAGSATYDWIASLFAHEGAYYIGEDSTPADRLKHDEFLRILQTGEMVLPRNISDQVRAGNYSGLSGFVGGSVMGMSAGVSSGVSADISAGFMSNMESVLGKEGFSALGNLGLGADTMSVVDSALRGAVIGLTAEAFNAAISATMQSYGFDPDTTLGKGGKVAGFGLGMTIGGPPAAIGLSMLGNIVGTAISAAIDGLADMMGIDTNTMANNLGWGGGFNPATAAAVYARQHATPFNPAKNAMDLMAAMSLGSLAPDIEAALGRMSTYGISAEESAALSGAISHAIGMASQNTTDPTAAGFDFGGGFGVGGDTSTGNTGEGREGERYGGLVSGPESGYTARLHGTEMVVSQKRDMPVKMAAGDGSDLVFEIRRLCAEIKAANAEMKAANYAIAKNTGNAARILDRWNGDGMPEERVI